MSNTSSAELFNQRMSHLVGPDLSVFLESILSPVKKSLRVNTHKISVPDFLAVARKNNWELTPIPWTSTGFFIDREDMTLPLGRTLEHFLGLFYIQEASSMLPAEVLAPEPGDMVLDMAAAPGSKTTQLSGSMRNQGLVLANDFSSSRTKALATNIERQGCINIGISTLNGKMLGDILPNTFDKILLDAPCSGEGTIYKTPDYFKRWNIDTIKKAAGLQKSLIASAFSSLKPGGILVYSTCTYAPEENEGVVDFLLQHKKGEAEILDIHLEGNLVPGVTEWEGMKFDPSLSKTIRAFPHKTRTGGFFVTKIRKLESVKSYKPANKPDLISREEFLGKKEERQYVVYLVKHYGIDETLFDSYMFTQIDHTVWLKPKKYFSFSKHIKFDRCGIPLFTINKDGSLKLSTIGAWAVAQTSTKNSATLEDPAQLAAFMRGENIKLTEAQVSLLTDEYVIVKDSRGFVLGTGLWQKPDTVKNQVPRHFVQGR